MFLFNSGDISDLAWSPDGKKIAYLTSGAGGEIYVINRDGTDNKQITFTGGGIVTFDW